MESSSGMLVEGAYDLFLKAVPELWIKGLESEHGKRNGIFSTLAVLWLLIFQRLHKDHTLSRTVVEATSSRAQRLSRNSKRVQEKKISFFTGGYSTARLRLSLQTVKMVVEQIFQVLRDKTQTKHGKCIYSLDGTTITLEHTKELVKEFPPARNGYGESYCPLMHVAVCHDLLSGYAATPVWGAMYGKNAQSETELGREIIKTLAPNSIVVGDKGFGIFSVCYAVVESKRDALFRLQDTRAKKILGTKRLPKECDKVVTWTVSRNDRKTNPDIPKTAAITGRIICTRVQVEGKKKPVKLVLFTNILDLSVQELIDVYGLRWNVETDLRHLKRTVNMHMLTAKSSEMVKKELLMGVAAYNFVHAVMKEAAEKMGLSPRELSFSVVLRMIEAFTPMLQDARTKKEQEAVMQQFFRALETAKLPKRRKKRLEPRALRSRPSPKFNTLRGSRAAARRKLG
jgi:Transposase DDE domain